METLREKGHKISDSSIEEGLLVKQPCRMEELPRNYLPKWAEHKRVFFDVGHNPQAIVLFVRFRKECWSIMRETSRKKVTALWFYMGPANRKKPIQLLPNWKKRPR